MQVSEKNGAKSSAKSPCVDLFITPFKWKVVKIQSKCNLPCWNRNSKGCVIIMLIVTFGRRDKKNKFEKLKSQISKTCKILKTCRNVDVKIFYESSLTKRRNKPIVDPILHSVKCGVRWIQRHSVLQAFGNYSLLEIIKSWNQNMTDLWHSVQYFGSFTTPSKTWTWFFSRVEKWEDDMIKSNRLWLEDIHP